MTHFYFDDENNGRQSFELPGAKPHYTPDRPGQVEHIFLDLVLDINHQSFRGTCTIFLKPIVPGIQNLTLDAVNLNIESVAIAQIAQPFDYDGERLNIELLEPTGEKTLEIAIAYSVERPQRGLYFIAPDEHYPHKPTQVWTQGEDEDSRFWFPCFDYPGQLATSEIRVRVPAQFMAISNGKLISTEETDSEKIYHWRQEQVHPTYLMTLAVGDFAEITDHWNDLLLTTIIAVAAFNVVSSLVLVIMDRRPAIAMLQVVGATRRDITWIYTLQGALIGFIGASIGLALGTMFAMATPWLVQKLEGLMGIQFLNTDVYPLAFLPVDIRIEDLVSLWVVALTLSIGAAAIPAWRANRLSITEALATGRY